MGFCNSYSVFDFFLLLLQGFGWAFKLEITVAGGGGAIVQEPAEEGDEDDDAVVGPVVVAATGLGSSSARLITGLFEGHHSYVEYVPDPRIAQYILSSRKRKSEVAAKHILPKRQRSIRQIASTGNVLVGELVLSPVLFLPLSFGLLCFTDPSFCCLDRRPVCCLERGGD